MPIIHFVHIQFFIILGEIILVNIGLELKKEQTNLFSCVLFFYLGSPVYIHITNHLVLILISLSCQSNSCACT